MRAIHTALSIGASSSDWVRETPTSDKVLRGKQVLSMNDKYRALRDGKATTYCRNRSYLLLGGAQCSLVPGGYFIHASTNAGETKL